MIQHNFKLTKDPLVYRLWLPDDAASREILSDLPLFEQTEIYSELSERNLLVAVMTGNASWINHIGDELRVVGQIGYGLVDGETEPSAPFVYVKSAEPNKFWPLLFSVGDLYEKDGPTDISQTVGEIMSSDLFLLPRLTDGFSHDDLAAAVMSEFVMGHVKVRDPHFDEKGHTLIHPPMIYRELHQYSPPVRELEAVAQ